VLVAEGQQRLLDLFGAVGGLPLHRGAATGAITGATTKAVGPVRLQGGGGGDEGGVVAAIGLAASVNMVLYGLTAPYAAALTDRFGIRRVVVAAPTAAIRSSRTPSPSRAPPAVP
jgi:MFS family permease